MSNQNMRHNNFVLMDWHVKFCKISHDQELWIILDMGSANKRCYVVMPPLIG